MLIFMYIFHRHQNRTVAYCGSFFVSNYSKKEQPAYDKKSNYPHG